MCFSTAQSIQLTYDLCWVQANCNCQGFSVMGVISMFILLLVFWQAPVQQFLLCSSWPAKGTSDLKRLLPVSCGNAKASVSAIWLPFQTDQLD